MEHKFFKNFFSKKSESIYVREFVKFLLEKDIYDDFIQKFNTALPSRQWAEIRHTPQCECYNYLSDAFSWSNTRRPVFWYGIHCEGIRRIKLINDKKIRHVKKI